MKPSVNLLSTVYARSSDQGIMSKDGRSPIKPDNLRGLPLNAYELAMARQDARQRTIIFPELNWQPKNMYATEIINISVHPNYRPKDSLKSTSKSERKNSYNVYDKYSGDSQPRTGKLSRKNQLYEITSIALLASTKYSGRFDGKQYNESIATKVSDSDQQRDDLLRYSLPLLQSYTPPTASNDNRKKRKRKLTLDNIVWDLAA